MSVHEVAQQDARRRRARTLGVVRLPRIVDVGQVLLRQRRAMSAVGGCVPPGLDHLEEVDPRRVAVAGGGC